VVARSKKPVPAALLLNRVTYTIPQFCARNQISRPTYNRLRAGGLGPVEMRPGLNIIRITAEAERDWQQLMQEERKEFELKASERAVKAGEAAAKSEKHISKRKRRVVRPSKQWGHNDPERRT
jgi:hypothetical protein